MRSDARKKLTTHDAPTDTGDVLGDGVAYIRRLIGAWDCCGTCAGGVVAARDAAQRAERDAEWRARIDDITAIKCAEARESERERIAQAIEAAMGQRVEHLSVGRIDGLEEAARIARAGTAGGSDV